MDFKIDPRMVISQATRPSTDKKTRDLKAIRESSREFEAMLVMEMMKAMRKTVPESSLFGKDNATETWTEMLDMETAKAAAGGKGLGIGEMMYNQMANLIEKKKTK